MANRKKFVQHEKMGGMVRLLSIEDPRGDRGCEKECGRHAQRYAAEQHGYGAINGCARFNHRAIRHGKRWNEPGGIAYNYEHILAICIKDKTLYSVTGSVDEETAKGILAKLIP